MNEDIFDKIMNCIDEDVKNDTKTLENQCNELVNEYLKLQQENEQLKKEKQEFISWLEKEINNNTPSFRFVEVNEEIRAQGFSKVETVNGPHNIMQPVHITLNKVLEYLNGDTNA